MLFTFVFQTDKKCVMLFAGDFLFFSHDSKFFKIFIYLLQLDELKSFDIIQTPFQLGGIGSIPLSEKLGASGHIPEYNLWLIN